jgi:hypothetical protein
MVTMQNVVKRDHPRHMNARKRHGERIVDDTRVTQRAGASRCGCEGADPPRIGFPGNLHAR